MTTLERKTYFITIYLPKDAGLRELIWKQSQGGISISGQILRLIAQDMKTKGLISDAENDSVQNFRFHRATNTERDHQNNNYSFYIPKDLWWIVSRFTENLQAKTRPQGLIPHGNRSRYIWSLFTEAFNAKEEIRYTRQAG